MSKIAIVDYGMGNVGSIKNMLLKIGADCLITSNALEILNADKVILPGVGAFDNAVNNLQERELISVLNQVALDRKAPILGICLGMQLLFNCSEEGELPGLGWIKGEVIKFKFQDNGLKIPHMGWNIINVKNKNSCLLQNIGEKPRFYFVHSYYVTCKEESNILATSNYGIEFTAVVSQGNIFGTQFHPEKSHKFGLKLLENFVNLC